MPTEDKIEAAWSFGFGMGQPQFVPYCLNGAKDASSKKNIKNEQEYTEKRREDNVRHTKTLLG